MKARTLFILALITLLFRPANAGQVTGTFATPGGSFVQNGTITFTLSQLAVKTDASQTVTPSTVSCYTSTDGSVVGLPNPLLAPTISATSGSMIAGTYYEIITFWNASGETLASPEQPVVLSSSQGIQTNSPALQPAGASGYKIYVGNAPGGEVLQATVTGFATTSIGSLVGGASPPISNTSTCNIAFNDTFIPANTTYQVSVVDSTGSPIPGFPQSFYFQGSTDNLNTMYPASGLSARFPQPIVASPINTTTQSINSNVNLNGHSLTAGTGTFSSVVSTVGTGSNVATAILNGQCITNWAAGADPGAKVNTCLAGIAAGTYTGMFTYAGGTQTTQILINNLSRFRWDCAAVDGGATSFTDGIVGNPGADQVVIQGTSSYITIQGCAFPGNGLTGASGNGHGIAIRGTGPSPAEISLIDVDVSGHKGNATDGTGATIPAAGVYTYKAIDIHIEGKSSFQANNTGVFFDTGSNDSYIHKAIINGNATGVLAHSLTTLGVIETDSEAQTTTAFDVDACVRCKFDLNHLESNATDMTSHTAIGFSNGVTYSNNSSNRTLNSAAMSLGPGAVRWHVEDNTFTQNFVGGAQASIQDDGGDGNIYTNNHLFVTTGATWRNLIIVGNSQQTNGDVLVNNTCGRTQANADGTISNSCVDVNLADSTTVIGTRAFAANGATIAAVVRIEAGATNSIVENSSKQVTGTGAVTNLNIINLASAVPVTTTIQGGVVTHPNAIFPEITAPSGLSGTELCYGDSTAHALKCSYNNGNFFQQGQTVASGTATMTTAAITGPNCGTTVTVAASGVLTTDTIIATDNAIPAATTNGPLTIKAWPTANNVNFAYCTPSGTITPAAATINWRVTR